jgi:hypothetical protein
VAAITRLARNVRLGPREVHAERRADGSVLLRSPHRLGRYPRKMSERLDLWADKVPERVFLAQRDRTGAWRALTYGEARTRARRVGQALLERNLGPERPLAVLSGNDIEHALLHLGAMYVGVPYAPISPAYSLLSSDFGKLRHIFELITPGLQRRLNRDRAPYEERFRELIGALPLPDDVDPSLLRLTLLGALNWTRIWYRPGKKTPQQIAHHLVDKILRKRL